MALQTAGTWTLHRRWCLNAATPPGCQSLDYPYRYFNLVERSQTALTAQVLVYPDPAKKPPPGEGLNKHATVTMYQCFPPGLCRIPMDSADFLVVPKLSEKTQHVA